MKRSLASLLLMLGCTLFPLIPSSVHASGFALPDQSSSAMGMASAFVGQADDVSAAWYNPAGLTKLDGTWVSAGITAISPSFKHETLYGITESIASDIHLPFQLYGSTKVNDRLALGLSINNPFGLSTDWAATSTTAAVATFSSVKTLNVNPSLAYKVTDKLSLAVGIDYLWLEATLNSTQLTLTGDGDGWGANAALLYAITDKLNLGINYRRKIRVEIDGKAYGSLSATTGITLPDELKLGVSIKATDALTLNIEADQTNWSTYNQVELTALGVIDYKEWQDTWCYRIGGQYRLSDIWKLRAGILYDTNPVREEYFDTRVPDSDREGVTLGVGYTAGKMTIDAAYMYLHFKSRTINDSLKDGSYAVLDGTYRATANIASVTLSYTF